MSGRRKQPVSDPVEETVEEKKEEVVSEPVAETKKGGLTYIVTNFRITYDHPKDNVQYSWYEGEELVDDGNKIPSGEVKRLHREGVLKLKGE